MNVWDVIKDGEYVIIALGVLLVIAIVIWWVRAVKLSQAKKKNVMLMHHIRDYVMEGDIDNAERLCEATPTYGAKTILAALKRVGRPMPEVFVAMKEARKGAALDLRMARRWILTIAVTAPALGLGGTLAGICHKLQDLSLLGPTADMAQLCAAIAPAIITTIAGLTVGVVAVVACICLDASIQSAEKNIIDMSTDFADLLNEPS